MGHDNLLKKGAIVDVPTASGWATRRVLGVVGRSVLVTNEDQFKAAKAGLEIPAPISFNIDRVRVTSDGKRTQS